MNKTRKRAIQKHRASEAKFDMRRKSEGVNSGGMAKNNAPSQATARPKSTRRQTASESGE